ncbi:MAG: UDP-N-acetylmuramoyl-L-alanyl-D-glutamate--2,6-diaminopimelate ligase [Burkholderiales bacterium]
MELTSLSTVEQALVWLRERGVQQLCSDSRRATPGCAFIAWPGYASDGRRFVDAACAAGAQACVVEADGAKAFRFANASKVATLSGLKQATGVLASLFNQQPSSRLKMVASTGTNGKTSTAWWMAQALTALGQRSGVVGTLGVGEPSAVGSTKTLIPTGLTTPDPVTLQATLQSFVQQGFAACALEASSIGLAEHRLSGTHIDVALFTNFTQDHLDYHGSMEAYWQAKAALFAWPDLRAAVVNVDDAQGALLAQKLRGKLLDLWTYSTSGAARLSASQVVNSESGLQFVLTEGEHQHRVQTGLIGDYNVANLLAVIGGLRALHVPLADAASVCAGLTPVPGRMQRVVPEGKAPAPDVVVDYAHTPDALEKVLRALAPRAAARQGQLWCVFGCGGNRDASKRPVMAAVAEQHAQHVVLTSDNPRDESPAAILAQVAAGLSSPNRAVQIEDRARAIAYAIAQAKTQDVVLLAGKGHEDSQEIQGRKWPFSDSAQAQQALAARTAAQVRT